ncbi:Rv1678 family membrane protein [Phytoactinopolyspora halotolerans]|uniref:Uncharacterized protein n=1 Tax=Phytoactinopolyspora halotolerans TaxID=1981512 RepID=A0A6L9S473_9ACTN|nr:hypothetical protein [Phytoactinopolyspora halotolerans]NED99277.1 hypothetical protein [Phytoactinopolyspora halotolerans]
MSGPGATSPRHPFDRACVVMGAASIVSVVFVAEGLQEFRFIWLDGVSVAIALGVGALACLAGLLARPVLAVVAGTAYLIAAVLQVISTAAGDDWLGGNISAASFWVGLGSGLLVVGLTPRDAAEPSAQPESPSDTSWKGTG